MVRHLDKHDWQWDKGDIWFHFVFMVLFWPLALFGWVKQGRPHWADWLRPKANRADYYREIEPAYRELKTCGAYVSYKPASEGGANTLPHQRVDIIDINATAGNPAPRLEHLHIRDFFHIDI